MLTAWVGVQYYQILRLGFRGYQKIMENLMRVAAHLADGILATGALCSLWFRAATMHALCTVSHACQARQRFCKHMKLVTGPVPRLCILLAPVGTRAKHGSCLPTFAASGCCAAGAAPV